MDYTYNASQEEVDTLIWMGENQGGVSDAVVFQDSVHTMLQTFVANWKVATANSAPHDVAVAYAAAPLADQQQVDAILNTPARQ